MSIFAVPSFYNQADQNIFSGGDRFITQERFRLGDPIQKNISFNSGIPNTTAANMLPPPPFIPNQGGQGGGGITTTGPANTAFDYEFDALGNVPNPDNVPLDDDEQDALDSFSNPSLNAVDIGTIGSMALGFTNPITGILGLVFNQRRKKQAAIKAAEEAAAAREAREAIGRDIARENPSRDQAVDSGTIGGNFGEDQGTRCFEPNTLIQMADGSEKKIKEIQLGDQTKGGEVTGVFQFKVTVDEIHDYKGVTVAGSHFVKEDGKFIMVQDSPISVKVDKIPVVYSLDTTGRRIFIKDIEFADYNGDGIAKGFLANAGVDLTGFDKEVLRHVENRFR